MINALYDEQCHASILRVIWCLLAKFRWLSQLKRFATKLLVDLLCGVEPRAERITQVGDFVAVLWAECKAGWGRCTSHWVS